MKRLLHYAKSMNLEEFKNFIKSGKAPNNIFIAGKSTAGKTTSSQFMKKYGYTVFELDEVVHQMMVDLHLTDRNKAFDIYKGTSSQEHIDIFVERVRRFIKDNGDPKLVLDGAIKDPKIIKAICDDKFIIVYLQQTVKEHTKKRASKRFEVDMHDNTRTVPLDWSDQLIADWKAHGMDGEIVKKTLDKYAEDAIAESKEVLDSFLENGLNVMVVNADG